MAFVLVSAAVAFLNVLNNIAAVILFRGADLLAVFDKPQRDALAIFFCACTARDNSSTRSSGDFWLFPFGRVVLPLRFSAARSWCLADDQLFRLTGSERDGVILPDYYKAAFR